MNKNEYIEFLRTLLNLLEEGNYKKVNEILDYHIKRLERKPKTNKS